MWPDPKNVFSAAHPTPVRAFFRRNVPLRSCRFVGLASTDFLDCDFEISQQIRRHLALGVRVRPGRERDLRGEGAGDRTPLPRRRSVDPWMLEQHAMFRRPRSGPEMAEQRALRTEELYRAGGCASQVLDAACQGDEPCS